MRHETLSEDPDLTQAIDDLLEVARELRTRSAAIVSLDERDPRRAAEVDAARDLYARIDLRAGRIGTTGDALVEILNAVIDGKGRGGRPAPADETAQALLETLAGALTREQSAHRAASAAQIELRAATRARFAAQEACRAYGAKGPAQ